jgi:ABC-2 type transport system permease protein
MKEVLRFFSLCRFHFRLYIRNSYFLWLPVTSTVSLFFLQYISAYASGNLADPHIWLRAGAYGLWASATTAAGYINFQRRQGILPYLVNNAVSDRVSLAALLTPATTFGLVSFPLAWLLAALFGLSHACSPVTLLGVLCYWLGALILDFAIAGLFVLTRNAIVYEQLIFIPLLLGAGLLSGPNWLESIRSYFDWVLPIGAAMQLIFPHEAWLMGVYLAKYAVGCLLWLLLAYFLSGKLLRAAYRSGEIGQMGGTQ